MEEGEEEEGGRPLASREGEEEEDEEEEGGGKSSGSIDVEEPRGGLKTKRGNMCYYRLPKHPKYLDSFPSSCL